MGLLKNRLNLVGREEREERQRGRRGKTTICLKKQMRSQKMDGKADLITQTEMTEKWWLGRETAHFGARSDMGGCTQSQPARSSQG